MSQFWIVNSFLSWLFPIYRTLSTSLKKLWLLWGKNRIARTPSFNANLIFCGSSSTNNVEFLEISTLPIVSNSSTALAINGCFPNFIPFPSYDHLLSLPRIMISVENSGKYNSKMWDICSTWELNVTTATLTLASCAALMRW